MKLRFESNRYSNTTTMHGLYDFDEHKFLDYKVLGKLEPIYYDVEPKEYVLIKYTFWNKAKPLRSIKLTIIKVLEDYGYEELENVTIKFNTFNELYLWLQKNNLTVLHPFFKSIEDNRPRYHNPSAPKGVFDERLSNHLIDFIEHNNNAVLEVML